MALSEMQRSWLGRARIVFSTPPSHMAACVRAGGATSDARALNPGFLGRDYPERGGVFCVGLANGVAPPEYAWHGQTRRELVEAWLNVPRSDVDDERFYRRYTADFTDEVSTWPYWSKHFAVVLDELGLEPDDVAHANLAPCRMVRHGFGPKLAELCRVQTPFDDLVSIVRPVVALVASGADATTGLLGAGLRANSTHVVVWNGRNFVAEDGRPRREWLPARLPALRRALGQSA